MRKENPIKLKLEQTTESFKELFPVEYRNTVEFVKTLKNTSKNEWADMEKEAPVMGRRLLEIPTDLFAMIKSVLSREEFNEVFEAKDHKLIRWYARKYPEFRVSAKV